jgi:hypothetical protein
MGWAISPIAILAAALAGCCSGKGPTHSCDFTPPEQPGADAGSDGPVLCGSMVCEVPRVCCVTKAPLAAACVEPQEFRSRGCEEVALPCFTPADCPAGVACCLNVNPDGTGTVACQAEVVCLSGSTTYVACASDADCPPVRPTCEAVSSTSQGEFKVCR